MAISGKNATVKVSVDGAAFNVVQDLNEATMPMESDNQDISTFGSDHVKRLQGLKDTTFELSGFYNADDTNGQMAIRSALVDNTALYVQFLPDGTTGFQQEVKVASYEVSAAVDGVVEVSIELEGTNAVTLV
ncbi:phage tail tube protein [Alkalihalobacillus sp. AL-G]|uniref:phage tail tube protein n=1 Tax=Alkalihalobacillus sp. AL-G TaxID=2926399 RepID=UPI00272C11CB|nr:phage tail tube protein [Alkalihalobacillus sp. AL-G]WLD92644.1 phage tail protein [Alkalihalobacillus sp. AL-G]